MQHPQIRLYNLKKSFNGREPLYQKLNYSIHEGDFVFLTGVSGAGKTTLFRLMMGLEKPTRGEVHYKGFIIHKLSGRARSKHRRKFGVIFQDYKLLEDKTARQNIRLPLLIKGMSIKRADKTLNAMAERLKITHLLGRKAMSLSGGEKQLVAIARAAVHKPEVILADEPTANLHEEMSQQIMEILQDLNKDGITILWATHNLSLIQANPKKTLLLKEQSIFEVRSR